MEDTAPQHSLTYKELELFSACPERIGSPIGSPPLLKFFKPLGLIFTVTQEYIYIFHFRDITKGKTGIKTIFDTKFLSQMLSFDNFPFGEEEQKWSKGNLFRSIFGNIKNKSIRKAKTVSNQGGRYKAIECKEAILGFKGMDYLHINGELFLIYLGTNNHQGAFFFHDFGDFTQNSQHKTNYLHLNDYVFGPEGANIGSFQLSYTREDSAQQIYIESICKLSTIFSPNSQPMLPKFYTVYMDKSTNLILCVSTQGILILGFKSGLGKVNLNKEVPLSSEVEGIGFFRTPYSLNSGTLVRAYRVENSNQYILLICTSQGLTQINFELNIYSEIIRPEIQIQGEYDCAHSGRYKVTLGIPPEFTKYPMGDEMYISNIRVCKRIQRDIVLMCNLTDIYIYSLQSQEFVSQLPIYPHTNILLLNPIIKASKMRKDTENRYIYLHLFTKEGPETVLNGDLKSHIYSCVPITGGRCSGGAYVGFSSNQLFTLGLLSHSTANKFRIKLLLPQNSDLGGEFMDYGHPKQILEHIIHNYICENINIELSTHIPHNSLNIEERKELKGYLCPIITYDIIHLMSIEVLKYPQFLGILLELVNDGKEAESRIGRYIYTTYAEHISHGGLIFYLKRFLYQLIKFGEKYSGVNKEYIDLTKSLEGLFYQYSIIYELLKYLSLGLQSPPKMLGDVLTRVGTLFRRKLLDERSISLIQTLLEEISDLGSTGIENQGDKLKLLLNYSQLANKELTIGEINKWPKEDGEYYMKCKICKSIEDYTRKSHTETLLTCILCGSTYLAPYSL